MLITINKEDYKRPKSFNAKKVEYMSNVGLDINKIIKVKYRRT